MPAFRLRVIAILDLQPFRAIVFVDAEFTFCNDSFKVSRANFLKEQLARAVDVLCIHQTFATTPAHKGTKLLLAFHLWLLTQVTAVDPDQVERIEHRFSLPVSGAE